MNKHKKLKRLSRKAMNEKPNQFGSQLLNSLINKSKEFINIHSDVEGKSDEAMENSKEEEQSLSEDSEKELEEQMPTDYPIMCRSIRIGSYKVLPLASCHYVSVNLSMDSLSFQAPLLSDATKKVHITLGSEDIQRVYVHFGRCLPIMFIFTTPEFGKVVRNTLRMIQNEASYFDPTSKDDTTQYLTFLIDKISQDQKKFIRKIFPGENNVLEMDMNAAKELLVRSTKSSPGNQGSDYPGVVTINTNPDVEEESDEAMKIIKEEQNLSEYNKKEMEEQLLTDYPIMCHSIRIGSYKVLPLASCHYVALNLSMDSLSFQAPLLSDATKKVHITLGSEDIQRVSVHFGRCLPMMFIFTTLKFGEIVRNALRMIPNETPYFDPTSGDDTTQKLTFCIQKISDDQKHLIRKIFPGDKKVREIDQKTANQMLVWSTPSSPLDLSKDVKVENTIDDQILPSREPGRLISKHFCITYSPGTDPRGKRRGPRKNFNVF